MIDEKGNTAFDGAFEVMLSAAAEKAAEDMGEEIQKPEEIEFSEEHEEKMKRIFARENRKLRRKRIIKYSKRCACAMLAFVIAAGVGIYNVEAWRSKVLNFFLEDEGVASKVILELDESSEVSHSNATDSTQLSVSYIPEGFDIADIRDYFILYKNVENPDIYFDVSSSPIDANIYIDTENMTQEHITINGYDAVYLEKESYQSVLCYDDNWVYYISGNIGRELIKIAEHVK
ncbi:MAG: DUF4367 domain-containing protein, partial [Oscillospiraceae bacterium]|nr:DUF4367 domain-containing protein [Oscillospiraceae bacterium]